MPFGFFKKKKQEEQEPALHYDPTNIRVQDLRIGFVLDYELKTWEVKEHFVYDWGDNYFTDTFLLHSGKDQLFLSVDDEDGELYLVVSQKLRVSLLTPPIAETVRQTGKPPLTLQYEGVEYYREEENYGYFRNVTKNRHEDSCEMVEWVYLDKSGKNTLSIEQYDEEEFEASKGFYIEEFEISNILPTGNPTQML
ncbi:DUF4178 domain-containing protein [Hugenholtzia roseola]|uniref:DUF4178 domain-containing protein n=1 Tax=Hugenholtzia roseola TaxID=1002 RepID=UPI000400D6B0|nr:DUF4178 domain-containing protein [Hugenholtzia roseola]